MGLTSHKLLALAALLAVFTVLGTLWVWPKLAVRSWPAMFLRLGTIAVTQLSLLVVFGLAVNDYFVFYSSWSDLLGHEHGAGVVQGAGGTPRATTPSGGPAAPSGPAEPGGPAAPTGPAGVRVLGTAKITGAGSVGTRPGSAGSTGSGCPAAPPA